MAPWAAHESLTPSSEWQRDCASPRHRFVSLITVNIYNNLIYILLVFIYIYVYIYIIYNILYVYFLHIIPIISSFIFRLNVLLRVRYLYYLQRSRFFFFFRLNRSPRSVRRTPFIFSLTLIRAPV